MVCVKILSNRGVQLSLFTRISVAIDSKIDLVITKTRIIARRYKTWSLIEFHRFIYGIFIPWTQKRYRIVASVVYRIHRRTWSLLEYSKQSSHKVSEYLKHISHKEELAKGQTSKTDLLEL